MAPTAIDDPSRMRSIGSKTEKTSHSRVRSSGFVHPIKDVKDIKRIKLLLSDRPRDLALFTLGINTAYRACEIASLTVGDVATLRPRDVIEIKQAKRPNRENKFRKSAINGSVIEAIQAWLEVHPDPTPNAPLFISRKHGDSLIPKSLTRLVKGWCEDARLKGNFGSHTMRKTWGYHQRMKGVPLDKLVKAFGHSTQEQTMQYLCIEEAEIMELYELEL